MGINSFFEQKYQNNNLSIINIQKQLFKHINVGFFSHNLEALKYENEDLRLIFDIFTKVISKEKKKDQKSKNLKGFLPMNPQNNLNNNKKNKNKNADYFENFNEEESTNEIIKTLDILFFSFQEIAEEKMLRPIFKKIKEIGYNCDSVQSNSSLRKLHNTFIGFKATYVVICHNPLKLNFLENHRVSDPNRSKSIHGGCYEPVFSTYKNVKFCFFGIHAQMVFEKSVPQFIELIKTIKLKYENPMIFLLGDTNVRSFQVDFYDENLIRREIRNEEDFGFIFENLWKKISENQNATLKISNVKTINEFGKKQEIFLSKMHLEDARIMKNFTTFLGENKMQIEEKNNSKLNELSNFYLEKDINNYENSENHEIFIKNNTNSKATLEEIFQKNLALYHEGDESSVRMVKAIYEEYRNNFNLNFSNNSFNIWNSFNNQTENVNIKNHNDSLKNFNDNNMLLNFLGNDNLRKLPPTYKLGSAPKRIERSKFFYNLKLISNKQNIYKEEKAFKFGLLDRLICFSPDDEYFKNCKVKEEEVNYYMIPELRVSDHMPIAGNFRIAFN